MILCPLVSKISYCKTCKPETGQEKQRRLCVVVVVVVVGGAGVVGVGIVVVVGAKVPRQRMKGSPHSRGKSHRPLQGNRHRRTPWWRRSQRDWDKPVVAVAVAAVGIVVGTGSKTNPRHQKIRNRPPQSPQGNHQWRMPWKGSQKYQSLSQLCGL